jgi:hypothetical protein
MKIKLNKCALVSILIQFLYPKLAIGQRELIFFAQSQIFADSSSPLVRFNLPPLSLSLVEKNPYNECVGMLCAHNIDKCSFMYKIKKNGDWVILNHRGRAKLFYEKSKNKINKIKMGGADTGFFPIN